jgi:hypothetical protein
MQVLEMVTIAAPQVEQSFNRRASTSSKVLVNQCLHVLAPSSEVVSPWANLLGGLLTEIPVGEALARTFQCVFKLARISNENRDPLFDQIRVIARYAPQTRRECFEIP